MQCEFRNSLVLFPQRQDFVQGVTNSLWVFNSEILISVIFGRGIRQAYDIAYDRYLQVANELEPRGNVNLPETRFRRPVASSWTKVP